MRFVVGAPGPETRFRSRTAKLSTQSPAPNTREDNARKTGTISTKPSGPRHAVRISREQVSHSPSPLLGAVSSDRLRGTRFPRMLEDWRGDSTGNVILMADSLFAEPGSFDYIGLSATILDSADMPLGHIKGAGFCKPIPASL